MKRIKLVNWILSLHPTKSYEVKVNSFCMCKSLIKINIVQTQLWEKPIYKLCLQKQHILPGLFIRKLLWWNELFWYAWFILFLLREKVSQSSLSKYSFHPPLTSFHSPKHSYTWAIYYQFNKYAVNFDMQWWTADTDCSFAIKF